MRRPAVDLPDPRRSPHRGATLDLAVVLFTAIAIVVYVGIFVMMVRALLDGRWTEAIFWQLLLFAGEVRQAASRITRPGR